MEALPGFDDVAAAERALGVALKGGGLERAPELVVTTARQVRPSRAQERTTTATWQRARRRGEKR